MPPTDPPHLPLVEVAIAGTGETDEGRLAEALATLAADDPTLHVGRCRVSGLTIVGGSSEDQLESVVERLRRELHVQVEVGRIAVAYKETITKVVEQEGKFVRSGGTGERYGHVVLRLAPVPPGDGVQFENAVEAGRQLPHQLVAAAKRGIREAAAGGVLADCPMIDFQATLIDATYHESDSTEAAFKIAGAMALKEGASKASPVILEPVMTVEVVTPEELMGEVMGDLSRRRGQIQGAEAGVGTQVITAEVPLQHMLGYASALRAMTAGRATSTMALLAFMPVRREPEPDGNEPVSLAMRVA